MTVEKYLSSSELEVYNSVLTTEKSVIDRLISQLESLQVDAATAKATARSEFINLEQTYIDLENQFLEVRKKLSETETENKELHEQVAASHKSLQPVVADLDTLLEEKKRLEEKVSELTHLLHQTQDESWDLKNKESERQREFRILQSQYEEVTRQCEAQKQSIQCLQKDVRTASTENDTLKLEQTTLQKQIEVLNSRIKDKEATIASLESSFSSESSLWSQDRNRFLQDLSRVTASETEAQRHLQTVKQELVLLQARFEESMKSFYTTNASLTELKSRSQQALQDQSCLLKEKEELLVSTQNQLKTLRSITDQMQEALEEAGKEQQRLKVEYEKMKKAFEEAQKTKDQPGSVRHSIQEETDLILKSLHSDPKDMAKELEQHGLRAVDLYARVVKMEEECSQLERAKTYAEDQLDRVLKELEDRAPWIAQLTQERDELKANQDRVATVYASLSSEIADKKKEIATLQKEVARVQALVEPLEKVAKDMQAQLRSVLRQRIDVMTGDDKSVMYSNLDELLESHHALLLRVHSLEQQTIESRDDTDRARLVELEKTLQVLKEEREKQEESVKELIRQRDMYRILLTQNAAVTTPPPPPVTLPDPSLVAEVEMLRLDVASKRAEIDRARREAETERRCAGAAREEVTRLSSLVATMEMKVQQMTESSATLQSTLEAKQQELDSVSSRLQTSDHALTVLRQQIEELRILNEAKQGIEDGLRDGRSAIVHLVDNTDASSTLSMLRDKVHSLEAEVTSLHEEVTKKEQRIDELSTVQMNRLQDAVEKEKIIGEQMENYKTQIKDLKEQLAAQERIRQAKTIAESEQAQRVYDLETKLQNQLSLLSGGDTQALATAIAQQRETQLLLDKASWDLMASRKEVERCRKHIEEGQAIAVTLQEELKQTKDLDSKAIMDLKAQLSALQLEKTALARQATQHEVEMKEYQSKEMAQAAAFKDVENQLEQRKNDIVSLQRDIETERTHSLSLQSALRESEERYQSIVCKNEENMKALSAMRTMQETTEAARVKAEQKTSEYQKQLNQEKEKLVELMLRVETLLKQNDVLYTQLADITQSSPASEESVEGLRNLLITVRRDGEFTRSALQAEQKKVEELKQACEASEKALKEILSKGDIDEALRRESEAKKVLEETQKTVEELQKKNADLQGIVARTSTRAEQLQKQVEELKSTLAAQQLQSSKQLDDLKNTRMMLDQQLKITRQQLLDSQQQFALYKSTHPVVTEEELASLRSASDRLKGVEAELMQLKQSQEKIKRMKAKPKAEPIMQQFTPSLFQKRSSIDLSLPAEKRLSVADSDTAQPFSRPSPAVLNPIQPIVSPSGLKPIQPSVLNAGQPPVLNPNQPPTLNPSQQPVSSPRQPFISPPVPNPIQPQVPTPIQPEEQNPVPTIKTGKQRFTPKKVALLRVQYLFSKYITNKMRLRNSFIQMINKKGNNCSFTLFLENLYRKLKLNAAAIEDINSISSEEDIKQKLGT